MDYGSKAVSLSRNIKSGIVIDMDYGSKAVSLSHNIKSGIVIDMDYGSKVISLSRNVKSGVVIGMDYGSKVTSLAHTVKPGIVMGISGESGGSKISTILPAVRPGIICAPVQDTKTATLLGGKVVRAAIIHNSAHNSKICDVHDGIVVYPGIIVFASGGTFPPNSTPTVDPTIPTDPNGGGGGGGGGGPDTIPGGGVIVTPGDHFMLFDSNNNTIEILIPQTLPTNWLFSNLSAFAGVLPPKNVKSNIPATGTDKDNLELPWLEQPRLLTHMVFDTVTKPKDHTYDIIYNITVSVGRTAK
jgi:hypothetical protein